MVTIGCNDEANLRCMTESKQPPVTLDDWMRSELSRYCEIIASNVVTAEGVKAAEDIMADSMELVVRAIHGMTMPPIYGKPMEYLRAQKKSK
jgi:hypothetical protein